MLAEPPPSAADPAAAVDARSPSGDAAEAAGEGVGVSVAAAVSSSDESSSSSSASGSAPQPPASVDWTTGSSFALALPPAPSSLARRVSSGGGTIGMSTATSGSASASVTRTPIESGQNSPVGGGAIGGGGNTMPASASSAAALHHFGTTIGHPPVGSGLVDHPPHFFPRSASDQGSPESDSAGHTPGLSSSASPDPSNDTAEEQFPGSASTSSISSSGGGGVGVGSGSATTSHANHRHHQHHAPAFQDSISKWLERSRTQMKLTQQQQQQPQQPSQHPGPASVRHMPHTPGGFALHSSLPLTRSVTAATPQSHLMHAFGFQSAAALGLLASERMGTSGPNAFGRGQNGNAIIVAGASGGHGLSGGSKSATMPNPSAGSGGSDRSGSFHHQQQHRQHDRRRSGDGLLMAQMAASIPEYAAPTPIHPKQQQVFSSPTRVVTAPTGASSMGASSSSSSVSAHKPTTPTTPATTTYFHPPVPHPLRIEESPEPCEPEEVLVPLMQPGGSPDIDLGGGGGGRPLWSARGANARTSPVRPSARQSANESTTATTASAASTANAQVGAASSASTPSALPLSASHSLSSHSGLPTSHLASSHTPTPMQPSSQQRRPSPTATNHGAGGSGGGMKSARGPASPRGAASSSSFGAVVAAGGPASHLQVQVSPAGSSAGVYSSSQPQQQHQLQSYPSASSTTSRGTNSLESAWRRKIVLNMNILPHSESFPSLSSTAAAAAAAGANLDARNGGGSAHPARELRSPMSGVPRSVRGGGGAGGSSGSSGSVSARHRRPARSQPQTPTSKGTSEHLTRPQLSQPSVSSSASQQPTWHYSLSNHQSSSPPSRSPRDDAAGGSNSPFFAAPIAPGDNHSKDQPSIQMSEVDCASNKQGQQQQQRDRDDNTSNVTPSNRSGSAPSPGHTSPAVAGGPSAPSPSKKSNEAGAAAAATGAASSFNGNQNAKLNGPAQSTYGGYAGGNSSGGSCAGEEQVDWAELCRSLTGEDLDAYEADTAIYLKEYYDVGGPAGSSSSLIDTLDGSIREMESRKAITLRIRQVGWVVAAAFALAGVGSFAIMASADHAYVPIGGIFYLAASLLLFAFTPIVGRQTRFFRSRPLLTLDRLQVALHCWAAVTCVTLFIGSLGFHSDRALPSSATPSQADGWARWILCCLPAFVGYLHHDLRTPAAKVWTAITACTLLVSHVVDEYGLHASIFSSSNSNSSSSGVPRGDTWVIEFLVQLLFLLVHLFFSLASSASIQSHVVQLWHRERFMLEQAQHLAQQREQAFSTANQKSSFLASMSHEIRTPLNGVIGLCSLVLESELTTDQRECLTTVIKSGETLLNIINDILLFSKLEANELMIEQLPFSPMTAVEDVLDIFTLLAQQQEIELIAHFRPGIPLPVYGDVMRLRQVLTNLVSNAAKFTPPNGEVVIQVEPYQPSAEEHLLVGDRAAAASAAARGSTPTGSPRCESDLQTPSAALVPPSASSSNCSPSSSSSSDAYLKFSITDTGCGIPRSKQHRLFQAFSQVDASDSRKHGGSGLGLVICQRLVALMHGRIGFETEVGRGSTFWFWVKLASAPPTSGSPAARDATQVTTPDQTMIVSATSAAAPDDVAVVAILPSPRAGPPEASSPKRHVSVDITSSPVATAAAAATVDDGSSTQMKHKPTLLVEVPQSSLDATMMQPITSMAAGAAAPTDASCTAPSSSSNPPSAAGGSADAPAATGAIVDPFLSPLSPSHTFHPSQSFTRSSAKLQGKRVLLVERAKSAAALTDLLHQWGCQVKAIHTREAWDREWTAILAHALQVEAERVHARATAGGMGAMTDIQSCRPVMLSGGGGGSSGHARNTFSYDVVTPKSIPSPATVSSASFSSSSSSLYDIILLLDTMVDDSFAPYSAYQLALAQQKLTAVVTAATTSLTRCTSVGSATGSFACLPPTHVAPIRSEQRQLLPAVELVGESGLLNASTCSTAEGTPLTPARRLSLTELNGAVATATTTSSSSTGASPHILAQQPPTVFPPPLVTALGEAIFSPLPLQLPGSGQSGPDGGVNSLVTPMAMQAKSDGSDAFASNVKSFHSPPTAGRAAVPTSAPATPSFHSAGLPSLPAFLLLLSHTPRHARHTASVVSSSRGFAGVVVKPIKWRALLQAMTKAAKWRPGREVMLKAYQAAGVDTSGMTPASSSALAHKRSSTCLPSAIPGASVDVFSSSTPADQVVGDLNRHGSESDGAGERGSLGAKRSLTTPPPAIVTTNLSKIHAHHAPAAAAGPTPVPAPAPTAVSNATSAPATAMSKAPSRSSGRLGSKSTAAPANSDLRILITEDNLVNQKVMSRMLNHIGYFDLTIAHDGVDCLKRMAEANSHFHHQQTEASPGPTAATSPDSKKKQQRPFDLVLMDLQMPVMDGACATRRIRSRICSAYQPRILATTANVLPADQLEFVQAGVDDFLAKPLLLTQLKAALDKCKPLAITTNQVRASTAGAAALAISSPTLPMSSPDTGDSGISVMLSPYYSGDDASMSHPSGDGGGTKSPGDLESHASTLSASPRCTFCCQLWTPADEVASTEEE